MSDDLNQEIKIGADATGVEAGVSKAKRSLKDLGDSAKRIGKEASDGVESMGDGGDKAAKKLASATGRMRSDLQKLLAEMKAGEKGSREYYEALADAKGISRNSIKPILDQIDAAKAKSLEAKNAAEAWHVSLGRVGPAIAAAFSGAALLSFTGKLVSVQREFDVLNSSLKTVTGSSAAAEREMAWLKQFAKETPFGLAQATQGFVKMKALGLDPTRASLTSFGNTASAMGKDLNQMVEAVADASTGEFERLKEFGIKAKVEGDKVSLTFQGVTKTIENSAKEITKYLEDIGNNEFGGAMAERAQTLDGAIAALGDTWDELFRTVNNSNAGTVIYDSITLAAGAIEDATAIIEAYNKATSEGTQKTDLFKTAQEGLAVLFETLVVLAANVKYVLTGIGIELGGMAAQAVQFLKGNFEGAAEIRRSMVADSAAARADVDALSNRVLNARKAQEELRRYSVRNASAATDPRRVDAPRPADDSASSAAKSEAELLAIRQKLYGQDKDYLPTLAKLQAAREARTITETEYIALVSELATKSYKASDSSKAAASAAKAEQTAYTSLIASIREKTAANQLEVTGGEKLTESQKLRVKLDQDLATGKLKLSTVSERQVRAELAQLAASEKAVEDYKEAVKISREAQVARTKETDSIEAWTKAQEAAATQSQKSIEDRIAGLESEEEAAQLARDTNISLAEAIERVAIARLREKRDGPTGVYEDSPEYLRLTKEIELREKLAQGIGNKETRERNEDLSRRATEKAQQEMERYIEDTQRGLGDAIEIAITDGSKAGGEKMREVLQEALLRKPLRMVIDGVLNQVTGGVLNLLGVGGGGAGGGSGSGILSLASNASSLYNGASAVGSIFSGAQGLGTLSSYAAGYSGAVLPASMVGPSIQAPTVLSNLGYLSNTGTLAGGSSAAGGAGMGAWGAGGIATLIMLGVINALGGMRSESMVGSGLAGTLGNGTALTPWQEWREGGTLFDGSSFATHNPLEELDYRRKQLQDLRDSGQGESNFAVGLQAIVTDLEKTTKGLATQTAVFDREINKGYKAYRDNVVQMADSLGLAGSSIEDFAYTLGAQDLNLQGLKPEEVQAKIQEVFGKAGDAMAKEVLGSWREVTDTVVNTYVAEQMTQANDGRFVTETTVTKRMEYQASVYAKTGETAIQTLERLSKSMTGFNEVSDALGFGIHDVSLAAADAADKFLEAAGGLERVANTSRSFIEAYYSDDKKREALARAGAREAERIGLKGITAQGLLGATPDQIMEGVNSLSSNPELYFDAQDWAVSIRGLWGAAEAAAPAVQDLGNAVDELTQKYKSATQSLNGDRDNLAVDLLRAQGDEVGAKRLERQQYLDSFVDAAGNKLDDTRLREIATLYDANEATRKYIQGIKDAAQAQLDALAKLRTDSLALIDTAAGKTDQALAAYERAADKERERLQGVIDTTRAVFQAAEDGAKSFFGEVDAVARFQGQQGRDFISQALASVAAGGALPDGKELSDAIAAVGKDFSSTQYASQAEADFQRLVVANELKGIQQASGDQLDTSEKQLKALNEQVEWSRDQVNLLRGIDSSLKPLPDAIAGLIAAYNNESQTRANVGAKAIIGTGSAVYDRASSTGLTNSGAFFDAADMAEVARDVIAANGAAGKASVLDALEGKGFTMAQYDQIFGLPAGTLEAEAKALGKPIYHSGTTYVPQTGFALLQQGEAVIPAAYNPWANGAMGGNDQAVVAELRAVKAELLEIRRQNDNLNYQAKRTADATNGQGEAPMLTEAT